MKKAMKFLIRDYFRQHLLSGLVVALLILVAQLSALLEPAIIKRVVDFVLPNRDTSMLLILAGGAIMVRLIAAGVQWIKLATAVGTNIVRTFAVDFYDHIQRLDLAFFADTKMGEFMQRLGQDTYHIYQMILNGLVVTISNLMS